MRDGSAHTVSNTSCAGQPAVVDIDCLLLKEQPGRHLCPPRRAHDMMVCVATFSPEVCSKTHSNTAETVDVSVELDEEIVAGIKAVGDSDAMQKLEEAVHTADSAFSKPEIEHLAFSCLNPNCMQDSVDSCSHS
jgi:hypothetical protein